MPGNGEMLKLKVLRLRYWCSIVSISRLLTPTFLLRIYCTDLASTRARTPNQVTYAVKRGSSYLNDGRSCPVLASCGTSPGNWHSCRIPVLDSVVDTRRVRISRACSVALPKRRRRPSPQIGTPHVLLFGIWVTSRTGENTCPAPLSSKF